jgi:hypothetical protein
MAVRSLNCDGLFDKDDDDENWADPAAPSNGRSLPGDDNDNDDCEGEEGTQGCEKGTRNGKGTNDGKGKDKATEDGKGKGKGKGKGIGELYGIIELYEEDSDTEG